MDDKDFTIDSVDTITINAVTKSGRSVSIVFSEIDSPAMEQVKDYKDFTNRYGQVVSREIKSDYADLRFRYKKTKIIFLEEDNNAEKP